MKKYLFLLPLLLLLVTGCGKKEVVCTGTVEEEGVKYETKVVAELKDDKVSDVKMTMTFGDEETAKEMCSMFELMNAFAEKEENKIEFTCDKKVVTVNSIAAFASEADESAIGLTADEFIAQMEKSSDNVLKCKK